MMAVPPAATRLLAARAVIAVHRHLYLPPRLASGISSCSSPTCASAAPEASASATPDAVNLAPCTLHHES